MSEPDLCRGPGWWRMHRPVHAHWPFRSPRFVDALAATQVRASVPMYILSRKIKAGGFKVVMSGEGADEIYGGYLFFHKAPSPQEFQQ